MTSLTTHSATHLLQQLLKVAGWRNSQDTILEALPHMSDALYPTEIVEALDNLKVHYTQIRCRERSITREECPALVIPNNGECYVALDRTKDGLEIIGGQDNETQLRKPTWRSCQVIRIDRFAYRHSENEFPSVRVSFRELRPMIPWLATSSFLTNILGLLTPLLIMAIYDRVIPAAAVDLLTSLFIGVVIIAGSDFVFRLARTKALAYVGWRGEYKLTVSLFRKLMSLPLTQLQKSDINQQLSRFRQFESLRELFTGQLMTTLLDLPFALIFLAVLLYIAPPVGLLTLGVVVLLAVLGLITIPYQQRLDQEASRATSASQSAVFDAIQHQRAIYNLGMQDRWMERSTPLAEAAEKATRKARQFQATVQSISQTVAALATVATIVVSAYGALNGSMTFGALIASIALVSKILAPIQALYSSFPQLLMFISSRTQADRVLSLPEETELGVSQSHQKTLSGAISFSSVTFRPDPLSAPLLSQVSFKCQPGEVVLIMSDDAAARGAMLDLIDGMFSPLAGTIEHDGIDIRQIAADELRKSVTYATYEKSLFYGTVSQNFRLAAPSLTEAEITEALEKMALLEDKELFPDGENTRLTDSILSQMPEEALKSLTLARSMARRSPIYLFSEPTNGLCDLRRSGFKDWVYDQRGYCTIVVATADRSFIQIADRFIFLSGGRVAINDTGDTGRNKLLAVLKTLGG